MKEHNEEETVSSCCGRESSQKVQEVSGIQRNWYQVGMQPW